MENREVFREIVHGSNWYQIELEFRDRWLRRPLGLSLFDENLEVESTYRHFGLFEGEILRGCLLAKRHDEQTAQLKQMAIDGSCRGKGVGRRLTVEVERLLAADGVTQIWLHAREAAMGFYEKLGYRAEGERFYEVTLPHFRMTKRLVEEFGEGQGSKEWDVSKL